MTTGTQSGATFGVCGTHVGASSSSFTLIWHQPLPSAKRPQRRLAKGDKQKLWKISFICFILFLALTTTIRQTSQWGLAKGINKSLHRSVENIFAQQSWSTWDVYSKVRKKSLWPLCGFDSGTQWESQDSSGILSTFFRQEHWSAEPDVKVPHLHWIVTARSLPSIQIFASTAPKKIGSQSLENFQAMSSKAETKKQKP